MWPSVLWTWQIFEQIKSGMAVLVLAFSRNGMQCPRSRHWSTINLFHVTLQAVDVSLHGASVHAISFQVVTCLVASQEGSHGLHHLWSFCRSLLQCLVPCLQHWKWMLAGCYLALAKLWFCSALSGNLVSQTQWCQSIWLAPLLSATFLGLLMQCFFNQSV